MRNFKLILEYDGSAFRGWQVQGRGVNPRWGHAPLRGERTVQGELEKTLAKVFKQDIFVLASGRTDSGVHAGAQVASFKAETRMTPAQIQKALNASLPPDMAVLEAKNVGVHFHARYSAKRKTYRYTVLNRDHRSAFWRDRAYFYPHQLDLPAMRRAAKHLVGEHDFKSFEAHDPLRAQRDTVRTVKALTVIREGDFIHIEVTANGFLYKMVRNMVGTLLAVGRGRMKPAQVRALLKAKNRQVAPETAPAHGLCLMSVIY
ncbi:MAG: tRNA pseudouridine(38-40) synthase TruA [Candidatus Omnitrophica bacterium]|nr:tRNA pseudouridine(38-40) synthase TruA [Candidatus Omnitrophota bacterium]